MSVCVCVHMNTGVHALQKRVLGPLELGLCIVGSHQMWLLGTKLWSLGRTGSTLTTGLSFHSLDLVLICFLFFKKKFFLDKGDDKGHVAGSLASSLNSSPHSSGLLSHLLSKP